MQEYRKLTTMPRGKPFTPFEYAAVINALQWVLWVGGSGIAPSEWFRGAIRDPDSIHEMVAEIREEAKKQ